MTHATNDQAFRMVGITILVIATACLILLVQAGIESNQIINELRNAS